MGIVLRPKFTEEDIRKMVAQRTERVKNAILLNLQIIGEQFIINARSTSSYKDQTGNLRSSTGYVILYNAEQIFGSEFEKVHGPKEHKITKKAQKSLDDFKGSKTQKLLKKDFEGQQKDGSVEGKKFIEEIKKKFSKGFVLIGVAGMDYAAAVEAKGYDVITSGSIQAASDLKKAIARLSKKS